MTSKEKAKQLIERFYFQFPNNGSFTGINNINDRWEEAVRCAIICCDEVLGYMGADRGTDFWISVKEEIQTKYNSPKVENKTSFGKIKFTEEEWVELNNGSKGSDVTSSQTEISDEEILASISYDSKDPYVEGYINGAKWYREQLKTK